MSVRGAQRDGRRKKEADLNTVPFLGKDFSSRCLISLSHQISEEHDDVLGGEIGKSSHTRVKSLVHRANKSHNPNPSLSLTGRRSVPALDKYLLDSCSMLALFRALG